MIYIILIYYIKIRGTTAPKIQGRLKRLLPKVLLQLLPAFFFIVFYVSLKLRVIHTKIKMSIFSKMALTILINIFKLIHSKSNNTILSAVPEKIPKTKKVLKIRGATAPKSRELKKMSIFGFLPEQ